MQLFIKWLLYEQLTVKGDKKPCRNSTSNSVAPAIEKRMQQKRPWKVVKVRCGYHEDRNVARDRHYASHPEDRDADIVILLDLCDDEEIAAEGQACIAPAGSASAKR